MKGGVRSGAQALRDYLVGPTVDRAAHLSPHYRKTIGPLARRVNHAGDLALLPILTKAVAVAAGAALYAGAADETDQLLVSSGTTREGRKVLLVRRSRDELVECARFMDTLHGYQTRRTADTRVLVLVNVQHGLPPGVPGPGETHVPWIAHPNFVDLTAALLADTTRPFQVIRGSVSAVMTLAIALRQRGVVTRELGIEHIGTNGYELTPRSRRIIQRAFGAEVHENYSLSELPSYALQCPGCGWLHFDGPPVIPELVDIATSAPLPLTAGTTGRLLLTGLFPYVQRTPLIRYDTGDVMTLGPFCAARGDHSLRFRGRARDTKSVRGVLLHAGDVYRVVDDVPGIARTRHPVELLGVIRGGALGYPKHEVTVKSGRIVARLALGAEVTDAQAQRMLAKVRAALLRNEPRLDGILAVNRVRSMPDRAFKP